MSKGETYPLAGAEASLLQPLTLKGHRHSIVGQRLESYDLDFILDVGGSTYLRDSQGNVRLNTDALDPLGIDTETANSSGRRYFSVNIPDDYDSSRRPDVFYDGHTLPFRDRAIDAVTAIDALEHVRPPIRQRFLSELGRVAGNRMLILFPFDSEANNKFETEFLHALRSNGITPRNSLIEHRALGLPDIGDVEEFLAAEGHAYNLSYYSPLDILEPYHRQQTDVLITFGQGKIGRVEALDHLLELRATTNRRIQADRRELNPDNAYRVLVDVAIEIPFNDDAEV